MRVPRTVRASFGLAAIAIAVGLVSAGCFPAGPPAPASLTVGPSLVTFPNSVGTGLPPSYPMPTMPVIVTNNGGHTAVSVSVHGVEVYSVPSSTCTTLAPGQSCMATIQFCPTTAGPDTQTLIVTGQDAVTGAHLQVTTTLTGTAI
jgi:hypothetical protein